jgi:uncharacterized coiled-coil DUF342 family protein
MTERIEPSMKNSNGHTPADIDMEHELGQLLKTASQPLVPMVKKVDDLGKMSGEAIMAQYEAAARSVEEMGEEVKERIAKLEAAMEECHKDMRLITEAAVFIREKGTAMRAEIEKASEVSNDIRSAVNEFKRKMGA